MTIADEKLILQGHYRFEGPTFPSIQELILHQYQSETPVTSRSGAILKKPVFRERWELSNDDVILLDKIGRVSLLQRDLQVTDSIVFRAILETFIKPN